MYKILIGNDYALDLIKKVNQAKKIIQIIMYDWRGYYDLPDHIISQFNQSLIRARARGVIVYAVVNHPYVVDIFAPYKIKIKHFKSSRLLHSKLVMIDEKYIYIGSHNLTKNAMGYNLELSVMFENNGEYERLSQYFNNLYLTN